MGEDLSPASSSMSRQGKIDLIILVISPNIRQDDQNDQARRKNSLGVSTRAGHKTTFPDSLTFLTHIGCEPPLQAVPLSCLFSRSLSLSSLRRILPTALLGSSPMNSISRGTL